MRPGRYWPMGCAGLLLWLLAMAAVTALIVEMAK